MPLPASCLVLDIATTTGWVLYHRAAIVSGSTCFKPKTGEGPGMRYLRFRKEFLNNFKRVSHIFFEEVHRHEGTDAAHIYGGLLAHLQAFCEEHMIPLTGIGVGVWKKGIGIKGNANKQEVMRVMFERGYKPKDDNESDALAIFEHLRKKYKS